MQTTHRLHVQSLVMGIARDVVPLHRRIREHDRDLANQLQRALNSVALNLAEGRGSVGGARRARFVTASGSLHEVQVALELAELWGYATVSDELGTALERAAAMLWRLANPR